MAIKINFDKANNPEKPTFVLAKRSGEKIGGIEAESIVVTDNLNDASEISFVVKKYKDGIQNPYWDSIVDFKLVWCKEWDMWFEINVEINESDETEKSVYCKQLGIAELSQIMLYEIEINTEDDIARDDYKEPTVFYNELEPKASLLHRITEKVPHYILKHVDHTLVNIQRTFTFDGVSLYDAFQDIAKEIGCLFLFKSNSDENGNIQRSVEVYDLEANCSACRHRGDFRDKCPECGSTDINEGYGHDTTIFISAEDIADKITFTTDVGSVKNCFRLEAGDDLMTAAVRLCNPNGSAYIWYLSDATKADMSSELVAKLNSYDELYAYYEKDYVANVGSSNITNYNSLVTKYQKYDSSLKILPATIKGFPALMSAYFNTIDMQLFLESVLMPANTIQGTTASKQAGLLTRGNLSPVSVEKLDILSSASADNAVLSMAKTLVDSSYRVKIGNSSYESGTWTGNFIVTNYSDDEDSATTGTFSITVDESYESFTKQKIEKMLNKDSKDSGIVALFKMSQNGFVDELKKYCLNSLVSFENAAQSCIDILIEQGISDKSQWEGSSSNLYNELYVPYLNKLKAIQSEIKVRENEIAIISGSYDAYGDLKTSGIKNVIERIRDEIQNTLNFEKYLGDKLLKEFSSFRREDKFSNDNYISDGLDNSEIFKVAQEFITVAKKEIRKAAELQHSISTSLKNLLIIEKFSPLLQHFEVGNWIRILIDDEIYKLRLIGYEVDFENIDNISVEFSDVMKTADGMSDQADLLNQASNMATSYGYVQRQADEGANSKKILDGWVKDGLDATLTKIIGGADHQVQTWDEHGMLFRRYNGILDDYDDIQMKIINSTIAITDDNWESTRTAIGMFYYRDVEKDELVRAYGINAEVVVGRMILGEQLGIFNSGGTMKFTNNGLEVSNENNTFIVNPNVDKLVNIVHDETSIFSVNKDGDLDITGNIKAKTLDVGGADGIVFDGENVKIGKNVSISWANISDKPDISQPESISDEYITTITKNTITSEYIKGLNLEVGNEIKMGANAKISWANVEDKPDIPEGVSDEYITTITRNTVTSEYIKGLNLEVGNEIKMGSNAKISWENVTNQPDIPEETDLTGYVKENLIRTDLLEWDKQDSSVISFDSEDGYYVLSCSDATSYYGVHENVEVKPSTTYTFSFEVKEKCGFSYNLSSAKKTITISGTYYNETGKQTLTFTTSSSQRFFNVYFYCNEADICYVRNVKLEEGNTATQWTATDSSPKLYTEITKNTVTTEYVNALKITADSVAAENITGTTITGKTFSGCTGEFTGKIMATSGFIGSDTGWKISSNVIRSFRNIQQNGFNYYYDYFMQSPNASTTKNAFAIRRTETIPNNYSDSSTQWSWDSTTSWYYPFKVDYEGHLFATNIHCCNITLYDNGEYGDGGLWIINASFGGETHFGESGSDGWVVVDGSSKIYPAINKKWQVGTSAHMFSSMAAVSMTVNGSNVTSDRKLKRHIDSLNNNLEGVSLSEKFIYGLKPSIYEFNDSETLDDRKHFGFYAQEVYDLITDIDSSGKYGITSANIIDDDNNELYDPLYGTHDDSEIRWSLSYVEFIAPLVSVVQKQKSEIDDLHEEVNALKKAIKSLTN